MGVVGLVFFLGAAVGMVRFPDFYTRMHAAGKGDTLSTMLMLAGFACVTMEDFSMVSWLLFIKIMAVVLFIYLTSPTSSHALMRAAFEDDEMPLTEDDLKKSKRKKRRGKK
jgi:multicomponent Na+:H+ antiporter subunit G